MFFGNAPRVDQAIDTLIDEAVMASGARDVRVELRSDGIITLDDDGPLLNESLRLQPPPPRHPADPAECRWPRRDTSVRPAPGSDLGSLIAASRWFVARGTRGLITFRNGLPTTSGPRSLPDAKIAFSPDPRVLGPDPPSSLRSLAIARPVLVCGAGAALRMADARGVTRTLAYPRGIVDRADEMAGEDPVG